MHENPDALTDEQWAERVQQSQYYLDQLARRVSDGITKGFKEST